MVTLKLRGQTIFQTEGVSLRASFRDLTGNLADLDTFPTVSVVEPSGNVLLGPTAAGVYRVETGVYGFDFVTGVNSSIGVWTDLWQGNRDGLVFTSEYNFIVANTDLPANNSDGYVALGDDPGFNYSQTAIININNLLKGLKARLKSSGKVKTKDQFGNDIYADCDIYTIDSMVSFLALSLSQFNEIPFRTFFQFDDTDFIAQYYEVLVQGAALVALSSQALIERGREYSISDTGIQVQVPTISEALTTQWNTELTNYNEKIKYIKQQFRPDPVSLGQFSMTGGRSPIVDALSWRRQNRIF